VFDYILFISVILYDTTGMSHLKIKIAGPNYLVSCYERYDLTPVYCEVSFVIEFLTTMTTV